MTAVLKGEDRDFVRRMLKEHSKDKSDHFNSSPESISEIIRQLEGKETKCGNAPLRWVEKMLQSKEESRPWSFEVRDMIFASGVDNRLPFWSECCNHKGSYDDDEGPFPVV